MGLQTLKELYGVLLCVLRHSQRRALRRRKENARSLKTVWGKRINRQLLYNIFVKFVCIYRLFHFHIQSTLHHEFIKSRMVISNLISHSLHFHIQSSLRSSGIHFLDSSSLVSVRICLSKFRVFGRSCFFSLV